MSLRLYTTGGHHDLDNKSEPDLKKHGNFYSVLIEKGNWIFYDNKNYNSERESSSKILYPGQDRHDISTVNGSVYLMPEQNEGIILFAHPSYSGKRECYNGDCADLNAEFQHGTAGGVSSAIVLGGQFDVFSEVQWGGYNARLVKGQYEDPKAMNIGTDKVQSIQKL